MRKLRFPPEIRAFAEVLAASGWRCHVVGGAVRDTLLGRPVADYDVTTDAQPQDVMACFRSVIPTGIKHGTVTVLFRGYEIEATTYRIDGDYSDSRRPDTISFTTSIEEDLIRRDFTINALAFDPLKDELVDVADGVRDLDAGVIRAVGNPLDRFSEDGLRIFRAVRFACQLGFTIEDTTFAAITPNLDRLASVSMERIRDEFTKLLLAARPSVGLSLMETSGILGRILPELAQGRGVEQKGVHRYDVLDHAFHTTDAALASLELRLAALFHDVGKPQTRTVDAQGVYSFYGHDAASVRITESILKRFRYPNEVIKEVTHLIGQHMFNYAPEWTASAVRRFVARVGPEHIESLLALRNADSEGITGIAPDPRALDELRSRIAAVIDADQALGIKDLAIGGDDLASLGIPRGPLMGSLLKELLETVLEDPEQNTRETLLSIAAKLADRRIGAGDTRRG